MRSHRMMVRAVALAFLPALQTSAFAQEAFTTLSSRPGTLPEDRSVTVVQARNVLADLTRLNANTPTITMPAFDGETLVAERVRIELIPGRGFIWRGRLVGQPGSSVILTVVNNIVSGNIDTEKGRAYQLRFAGGGVYSFREIDRSRFSGQEEQDRPSFAPPPPVPPGSLNCADSALQIDVMVVYTPAARIAAGGTDAIESLAYHAVAVANESYIDSDIAQRLSLVHVQEVNYTESGSYSQIVENLADASDMVLDDVAIVREVFAADVVSLIVEDPTYALGPGCGWGKVMAKGFVDHSFWNRAYSAVRRDCAADNFDLAHEIGHNMGAHHQTGNGADDWSHAFDKPNPTDTTVPPWRTVMGDQTSPPSGRVGRFSNPNVNFPLGSVDKTGIADIADNHRTLNGTASIVANFRCSSPSTPHVWMKDTWNDTGAEPDPLTAAEDMWKSPYIWVRNTQDNARIHQHEHENPIFGASNWVYVKMHNGDATAASGELEVYWANASTSISWPNDWNLLSSVSVTGNEAIPPMSSKIVELPWNNLPGTGHYCLVARWNSTADPMATAEGPDIDANVRANNNLIWRNLHVVPLPEASAGAMIEVMNPDKDNDSVNLVIRSSHSPGKPSFLAVGEVAVALDDVLNKAWQAGGSSGEGFKVDGDRILIGPAGASFDNLLLPVGAKGRLKVVFRRFLQTPKRKYVVDVVQTRPERFASTQRRSRVVGGVSYEIHVGRGSLTADPH